MAQSKKPPFNPRTLFIIGGLFMLIALIAILMQEYTFISGEKVFLETRPVDPRDLLRGDYVILEYAIETSDVIGDYFVDTRVDEGDMIYLILTKNEGGVGSVLDVSLTKPDSGLYIRAEVIEYSRFNPLVDIGISKYFIPENTGRSVERLRGSLLVQASVDDYGTAKIKDIYMNDEIFVPVPN